MRQQFNFRIKSEILDQVKRQAEVKGMTISEFMEDACLIALGASEEDRETAWRIHSQRDKDRITQLEKRIEELSQHINRLDSRIDATWDSIEYTSDSVDAVQNFTYTYRDFIEAVLSEMSPEDLEELRSSNQSKVMKRYLDKDSLSDSSD